MAGWSHHAAEPCGCPFSLHCSLPVPTCGKPTNVSSDSWEQVTGTWQCDTSKEHFPLAVGSPHRWKQPLESKGKHRVTRAPEWQPLEGPPAGTGHWIPAVCGLSLCCPQGGEDTVKGKGKKAAPLPTCMTNSSDGCLGVPSYRSIPMGRQPQGVESRTCDGPAPWFLLPHRPRIPGKTTQDLLLNCYSQN